MVLKQIYYHRFENVAYFTMKQILDITNIIKMNLISGLRDHDTKAQIRCKSKLKFFENIEERSRD